MKRNSILLIALIAVIVIIGAAAYWTHGQASNGITTSDTKLAFYNNGSTWMHSTAVIENATLKNGTQQNFYVNAYLEPQNGTVVLDLSDMLGYGDQKVNAQTMRVLTWRGLVSPTPNGTSNLNLNVQGWSNNTNPQSYDIVYNMALNNLTVNQLPATITGNNLTVSSDITQYQQAVTGITQGLQPVYEEYIVNVDANGKVTIVQVQAPTLCNIMANIL